MHIALIILYGLLGAFVGAALDLVADRMPRRVPLLEGSPACETCDTEWRWLHMIPVWGYMQRRGRCPTCDVRLPWRTILLPIATALVFAWLAWFRGLGFELLADSVYSAFLLVIAVIDLEHKLILNRVVFPALWAAVGLMALRILLDLPRYLHYGYWLAAGWAPGQETALIGALSQGAGAFVAFAVFFVMHVISPSGMGDGDVRLAALGGLITGFPGALAVVFGAFFVFAPVGVLLLFFGKEGRKTAVPFGPFLVLSTWVVMLWGDGWLLRYIQG